MKPGPTAGRIGRWRSARVKSSAVLQRQADTKRLLWAEKTRLTGTALWDTIAVVQAKGYSLAMSTKAQALLDDFKGLPPEEQWSVYQAIARSVVPKDYGPLSDDDLTAIAAQSFAKLDEEEARAESR